jgi:protein phosphatase
MSGSRRMNDLRTLVDSASFSIARGGESPDRNEDSFKIAGGDGANPWADFVGIVSDGVGTSKNPAGASRVVVESWVQFLERRFVERPADLASFDEVKFSHLLRECFAQSHRQALRAAPGGSATAAGACIEGDWLLAATIGDARVYHLHEEGLDQVTPDQIDASGDPTDVLGGRQATPNANAFARRILSPGDWIVVCSDGLQKTLSNAELEELLRNSDSPQLAARTLKQRVVTRNVPDDVTAILARIERVSEPFWQRGISSSNATAKSRTTEPVQASERAKSASPPAPSPKEPPMSLDTELSAAFAEIEKRLTRLERSPSGGELSPQERSRLERDFGRLERRIAELAAPAPAPANFATTAWLPIALLVVGLGTGIWIGGNFGSGFNKGKANADQTLTKKPVAVKEPGDMEKLLGYQTGGDALVFRYLSDSGETKIAVYRLDGDGEPAMTYEIPATSDASAPVGTGAAKSGSNKGTRSQSRTATSGE